MTDTTLSTPRHALHWFEIPVTDMARAKAFYEALLQTHLQSEDVGPSTLAVFDYSATGGVGGCLKQSATAAEPSLQGTIVYLGAEPSLDAALARVEQLGGHILLPPVQLPGDMGSFAHIRDSEGNRIGLHAEARG